MGKCANCGNNYDKSFDVTMAGKTYTFDSFDAPFNRWRPFALIVIARSSVTAWRRKASFIVAPVARKNQERGK